MSAFADQSRTAASASLGPELNELTMELTSMSVCAQSRITGKERDTETGLDYFGARYFGSNMGRFTTVDPIAITRRRLLDPQELNLYSYTRNNPMRHVDPDGREYVGTDGKKVDVTVKNGSITLGANASADLKKVAALVAKSGSKDAVKMFKKLADNSTRVTVRIATRNSSNEGLGGLHQAHDSNGMALNWEGDGTTGKFDGEVAFIQDKNGKNAFKEATITLYESVLNTDELMVSDFVHEGTHDVDQKSIDAIKDRQNGIPNMYDVEKPAGEAAWKVGEQIKKSEK